MKILTIYEAEKNFSSLLSEIEKKGEIFVICQNGKPVADLIPHHCKKRTDPHPLMSRIVIGYEPTETLSADEWTEDE